MMNPRELKRLVTETKATMSDFLTSANRVLASLNRMDEALEANIQAENNRPADPEGIDVIRESVAIFLSQESKAKDEDRITYRSAQALLGGISVGPLENLEKARTHTLTSRRNGKTPTGIALFGRRHKYTDLETSGVIPEQFGGKQSDGRQQRITYNAGQFRKFLRYLEANPRVSRPRTSRRRTRTSLRVA